MATYRTFVFPSLHNKRGMDIVAREVVNFFRNLFPNNFFKYIYVDTSTNAPNMFMTENNDGSGEIIKEGVQKVAYPRLIVRVRPKENNVEDTTYEKLISIYKYPISQMVRTDFTMTCLFFDGDPYHIQLATMDDYSRSEIEFQISVQSKDDQEAVSNILSVCCKKEYGYPFLVRSEYMIPVSLTDHLRDCVFRKELQAFENNSPFMSEREKDEINFEIQRRFTKYLNEYSMKDVVPKIVDEDSKELNKEYILRRGLRIYLKIDQWEKDDGNKKENVYDNFTLTANGFYECYHPNSFFAAIPTIIRGVSNSKIVPTSNSRNVNGSIHTLLGRETYREERREPVDKRFMTGYTKLFDEREIIVDNPEVDYIDVFDWIPESEKLTKETVRLLIKYSTLDELKNNTKIFVYEDRDIIDPSRVTLCDGFVIKLTNNDVEMCYYVEVYIKNSFLNSKIAYALEMEKEN